MCAFFLKKNVKCLTNTIIPKEIVDEVAACPNREMWLTEVASLVFLKQGEVGASRDDDETIFAI